MNKKTHIIPFFLILLTVFVVAYKNSNVKGFRRFLISLKLAVILTFSLVSPADAKDNGFLTGADGFTPPLSRPAPNNYGYFGSKTTSSSSGAPKKGPNGSPSANSNVDAKPKFAHQINLQSRIPTPKKRKKQSVQINMDRKYAEFQESMHPNTECSRERFEELCRNLETGKIDKKSIEEAKTALRAEAEGIVENVARPSKNREKRMRSDFVVSGPPPYTHLETKKPIDFKTLEDKGIDITGFPSLDVVAANMGRDIPTQKEGFCGMLGGPVNPENVLHLVDFENIPADKIQSMQDYILINAENRCGTSDGIKFLNVKDL